MKRHEFTQELEKALTQVDHQTRAEIMADINEHFAEGISQGLSEEEICKNLGQPGQIAEDVLEELRAHGGRPNNNYRQSASSVVDAIGDLVGDIGSTIGDAIGNLGNIGAVINMDDLDGVHVFNMGGHDDRQNQRGHEINIDQTFSDIHSMDISLNICDLQFVPSPQGEATRVVIQGSGRGNGFILGNNNGTLMIKEKNPVFRFEFSGFRGRRNVQATIYVPVSFKGDIRARTNVGGITVGNICGNVDAKTNAGGIHIKGLRGQAVRLRSSAGSIKFEECDIINVDAKSSAGTVHFSANDATNLHLNSSAGVVDVRVTRLLGETSLSSSAGGVRLEAKEAHGNISLKSSAGNVHARLPKDVNCRIEAAKPSIGSLENHLVGNPQSPHSLRASTSVGAILLEAM